MYVSVLDCECLAVTVQARVDQRYDRSKMTVELESRSVITTINKYLFENYTFSIIFN